MATIIKIPRRLQPFNALEIMNQAIIARVNTEAELEYADEPHNYFGSTRDDNYHRFVRDYKGTVRLAKHRSLVDYFRELLV